MKQFDVPCYKIASATMKNEPLIRHTRSTGKPVILSTGMSSFEDVDRAVGILGRDNLVLLHAVSTYPADYSELNLRAIVTMKERYNVPIGYSGHETGIPTSVAAVAMGACIVERHITLDRAMWGSDQAASLEPNGITRLVRDIRLIERSMGDGNKRSSSGNCPSSHGCGGRTKEVPEEPPRSSDGRGRSPHRRKLLVELETARS